MANKAYIVANKQQEQEVLDKLERECLLWHSGEYPTEYMPSKRYDAVFPYAIFIYYNTVYWNMLSELEDEEIVYDGRKESKMKISKEVYDALVEWRDANHLDHTHINGGDLLRLPTFILNFWLELGISQNEANNRLIAIIRWLNGEQPFEVEKPKKWVIRSKDCTEQGNYLYVMLDISHGVKKTINFWDKDVATRFDTKEEAESWANSHQEVVEVKE